MLPRITLLTYANILTTGIGRTPWRFEDARSVSITLGTLGQGAGSSRAVRLGLVFALCFLVLLSMAAAEARLLAASDGLAATGIGVAGSSLGLDVLANEASMGEDLGDAVSVLFPDIQLGLINKIALFLVEQGATTRADILCILRTMGGTAVLNFASQAQPPLNLMTVSTLEKMVHAANAESIRAQTQTPQAPPPHPGYIVGCRCNRCQEQHWKVTKTFVTTGA